MAISAKCGGDRLEDFRLDLVGGRRRPGSTVSGAKGRWVEFFFKISRSRQSAALKIGWLVLMVAHPPTYRNILFQLIEYGIPNCAHIKKIMFDRNYCH